MSFVLSLKLFQQLETDLGEVGPKDLENAAPNVPAGFADNVVGTASVSLQHLFVVLQGKAREVARTTRQHELDVHLADIPEVKKRRLCEHFHKELEQRIAYVRFLKEALLASLRAEHPELNEHPLIDVRKGWQVVWIDEEKQLREMLSPLIHGLLGESTPTSFSAFFDRLEEGNDDPNCPIGRAC